MVFPRASLVLGTVLIGAACAAAQSRSAPPDQKEIRDYRLNMDVIDRCVQAFKAISTDPAARKCGTNGAGAATLDESEKRLNACPAAMAHLKDAGIKPREFMIVTVALISDVTAVGMKRSGTIKKYPDSLSPENAAFVEQNFSQVQAKMNAMGGK